MLSPEDLRDLGRAIGDSRIVLLGENGHGVAQFTTLKSGLVRWLHQEMGFEVLAVESGYAECEAVNAQLPGLPLSDAIRRCMAYAFEHAELQPLFRYLGQQRGSGRPVWLSGLDLQTQGADSRSRPGHLRDSLRRIAPAYAVLVGALDSTLLARTAAGPDSLRQWVRAEGDAARALYDSAAAQATGTVRWMLLGAGVLLDRLVSRETAAASGRPAPVRFYQRRDEWMARTVSWLADSVGGPRKVVVWLHNDHARSGSWMTPAGPARATGSLLRETYPGRVYSIGFFMGRGAVADNSRRVLPMLAPPEEGIERALASNGERGAYLLLSSRAVPAAQGWAKVMRHYLRNGLVLDSLIPAREFDALMYVDSVTPAGYRLP
ncbi:MAG TPA: erythromycin esterase family protein [Gemmatimonadales bacterium]